ncbi:unnamed protein product [Mucor hiemalis]
MSMPMNMNEMTQDEKDILGRQYAKSPFGQHPREKVTTLDIFDFDSTLFLSPMLSCNTWHHSFINAITTENLIGPGWWRDIRSLPEDGWYWNEDVVNQVRLSSKDPTRLTVLLTGRRYYPFHALIDRMLASKGLVFDIIGLRPDPEHEEEKNALGFNYQQSVFETTMEFKMSFIVFMLTTIPTLTEIIMWDDRISHISIFQTYLRKLESAQLIHRGELVCVKAERPKYNPTWEKETVEEMIRSHNEAIKSLDSVPATVTIEGYDGEMISSKDMFKLRSVPSVPSLTVEKSTSHQLKALFLPLYEKELLSIQVKDWEVACAEEAMYFGTHIFLSPTTSIKDKDEYRFRIINRTQANLELGMLLQVELCGEYAILPLWYKPSMFSSLSRKNDYAWIPVQDSNTYLAHTGHHHLLTVTKA